MTTQPLEPRTVGDYAVQSRLGEGGMGIVYLARHRDGSPVALKVLRPHIIGDDRSRERLAREVDALARVRSPWVADIIDADPWGETPYVVTRYVPGPSLHDYVSDDGPLHGGDLLWLAGCLAEGIAAVHAAGVLHRDVKPANVLMEGRTPILIDFGLAQVADDPRLTQAGWLLGTPGYLAPELLHGETLTPAVDVHAWAATVAFAGTGHNPYGTGPSMAIMDRTRRGEHDVDGLNGRLRLLVEAALAPDPLARPTLAELRAEVRRLAERSESPAAATQVLTTDDADPSVGFLERVRRASLVGLGAVVVGAATSVAPLVTLAVLVVLVWLLRSASLTASATAERRTLRGRHWYDVPRALCTTPWHLLRGTVGTALLLGWCLAWGAAAVAVGFAVELPVPVLLFLGGAVGGLALGAGPGAARFRSPMGRLLRPLARRPLGWCFGCVALLLAAATLGVLQGLDGTNWFPLSGPPW